ncbi:MAG: copper resistance protein CopC [Acidimicrobiales bacterium]
MRAIRLAIAAALGFVGLVSIGASAAAAHATIVSVEPADGAVVAVAPSAAILRFDQGVDIISVRLIDGAGVTQALAARVERDGSVVRAPLPALSAGTYALSWRVVSADGHPVDGASSFGVAVASVARPPTPSFGGDRTVGVVAGAVRAVGFGAALVLLGLFAAASWWWPGLLTGVRARRSGLVAAALNTLFGLASIGVQVPYGRGTGITDAIDVAGWSQVLTTQVGAASFVRALVGLAAAVLLAGPAADTVRRWWRMGAAALGLGLLGAIGAGGHASTGPAPVLGIALDAVHLAAAGLWTGGLLLLVIARPVSDRVVRRFSRLAAWAVGAVAATGTLQAVRRTDLDALASTGYGRLLLAKVAVVVVLVAAGGTARRILRCGHLRGGSLRRVIGVEVALAGVVVGLSAALVVADPAALVAGSEAELGVSSADLGPLALDRGPWAQRRAASANRSSSPGMSGPAGW